MTEPRPNVAPPPPPSPAAGPPPAPHVAAPPPAPQPALPPTTLASPPGMPAFHPRAMLVASALGGPLNRVTWVAAIVGIVLLLVALTFVGDRPPLLVVPLLPAVTALI